MRLRELLLGLTAAAGCVGTAQAAAFTDETAWRTAVGNVYALETWDTPATPTLGGVTNMSNLGIRFLPLNDGSQPTVQPYGSTGGVVRSGPNNLLNDADYSLPGRGPINVVPLVPGQFLFGLGMWNVGGDDQLSLTFYDAGDNVIESVTSAISSGFFGIVNSSGAVRAQVAFVQGNGYAPTDDWQTAARGTFNPNPGVPEPGTWALMILGFGLAGAALRRRPLATA
jgi:hypothetical protein